MKAGLLEHLPFIPLPVDKNPISTKADLALADLVNGGVLSPNQVRKFVSDLVEPAPLPIRVFKLA